MMPNLYIAIAIIAVLGLVGWKIDDNGYDRCEARYITEAVKDEQEATIKIETIREQAAKRRKVTNNVPVTKDEDVISPVLRNTLDGLRARHAKD